jgi:type IV secretion system protein VirB9
METTMENTLNTNPMNTTRPGAAALALGLVLLCTQGIGCASAPEGPQDDEGIVTALALVESTPAEPDAPAPEVIAVPYAKPVPGQARPMPAGGPTDAELDAALSAQGYERGADGSLKPIASGKKGKRGKRSKRRKKKARTPSQVIARANEAARRQPAPDGFYNSIQRYDYMEGALYTVYGAPNHLTVISFEPGETLRAYASGDTIRWMVDETTSGAGAATTQHLVLQPQAAGLHTTLLVTTSRGIYNFELESNQHTHMARVAFNYPGRRITRKTMGARGTPGAPGTPGHPGHPGAAAPGVAGAPSHATARPHAAERAGRGIEVDIGSYDDSYKLVVEGGGAAPSWAPVRVFHDGARTFIEFPEHTDAGAPSPALFLLADDRTAEVVQYARRGNFYVVPRVVRLAVLTVGQQRVGLEYTP